MQRKNLLTELLNITYPVIQGPMSGITTPELVAAVSNTGCLGCLGAGQMQPHEIRAAIAKIRHLTDKPFAVNLFIHDNHPYPETDKIAAMNAVLNPIRLQIGIPEVKTLPDYAISFDSQLEVLIEEKIPIFSFTMGVLSAKAIASLKQNNIVVMGTATTVHESIQLEKAGVNAVIAQGTEAGGHRGSAMTTQIDHALIGTLALIPQMASQLSIPIIAAGGIMNGKGIQAVINLGASAAQLGTAFMTCHETNLNAAFKTALLNSTDESTCVTATLTGRYARGIENELIRYLRQYQSKLLPYPYQRFLTQDIVNAAKAKNNPDYMMMWCGQAAKLARSQSVQELITQLCSEFAE